MFIECVLNNGVKYLRLSCNKKAVSKKGLNVTHKNVLLNIGPLSRFDGGKPDYLERLRESFRNGNPLIESLIPYVKEKEPEPKKYLLEFTAGSSECVGDPKYFAHALLERLFTELGLTHLFSIIKSQSKIEYDLLGLSRLLVYGRIMNPDSKISTLSQIHDYYGKVAVCENPYQVYDALDVIYRNKSRIIRSMNTAITKKLGRNPEVVFYDVTNFFFESPEPDEDREEDGVCIKGLRKKGVSKEHRDQPIVQMGLFMDDKGLPISLEIFPGNTLDQATLRPALKATLKDMAFNRFILVADRGLCSYKNTLYLTEQGHGYIVSKSIAKTCGSERAWILEPDGYIHAGDDFKYKSRIVTRRVQDEAGTVHEIREKVVVYWSRRFYEKERYEHRSFLKFVEKLRTNPTSFRITSEQKKSMERFFKKEVVHAETGEILDSSKLIPLLDEEKLEEYTAYMGYYQLISSETEMDDREIIDKYHGLSRIEDQFRVMKGDLATRPMYVRTPEHIEAHLVVCLIALTILRLIQRRIVDSGLAEQSETQRERYWTSGLTGERVQNALKKWRVELLASAYYRFCSLAEPDLKLLLDAYGIHIPADLFTSGDLQSVKTSFNVF